MPPGSLGLWAQLKRLQRISKAQGHQSTTNCHRAPGQEEHQGCVFFACSSPEGMLCPHVPPRLCCLQLYFSQGPGLLVLAEKSMAQGNLFEHFEVTSRTLCFSPFFRTLKLHHFEKMPCLQNGPMASHGSNPSNPCLGFVRTSLKDHNTFISLDGFRTSHGQGQSPPSFVINLQEQKNWAGQNRILLKYMP